MNFGLFSFLFIASDDLNPLLLFLTTRATSPIYLEGFRASLKHKNRFQKLYVIIYIHFVFISCVVEQVMLQVINLDEEKSKKHIYGSTRKTISTVASF